MNNRQSGVIYDLLPMLFSLAIAVGLFVPAIICFAHDDFSFTPIICCIIGILFIIVGVIFFWPLSFPIMFRRGRRR